MRKSIQRAAGVAVAALLAGTGVVGAAQIAQADTINPTTKGSITVHKFEQPENSPAVSDGSQLAAEQLSGLKPIAGVGFTLYEVNGIDLSKASDWDKLKTVKATLGEKNELQLTGPEGVGVGKSVKEAVTNEKGELTFSELNALKTYVVHESKAPVGAVSIAQPTVITVPYPGNGKPGVATWNYNPHIYPKNVVGTSGSSKNNKVHGSHVTWNVNAGILPLGPGENGTQKLYTSFKIEDTLSKGITHDKHAVKLFGKDGKEVELVKDTDYTTKVDGQLITLEFKEKGFVKLNANISGKVVLTIEANANGTGNTANTAKIFRNGQEADVSVPAQEKNKPEDPAKIRQFFGGAFVEAVAKHKGSDKYDAKLADAKFELYAKDDVAPIGKCPGSIDEAKKAGLSKVDTGKAPFVTGKEGKTPGVTLAKGEYCAYEVGTPAGYNLVDTKGMLLNVQAENANVTFKHDQVGTNPGDLPALPITGATGQVLVMGLGAGLIAVAAGLYLARRKRAGKEASSL